MKTASRGFLIAFVLLLFAAVMPPAIQGVVIASASAGTYEDNVFRPGEPRWGSSPRFYEDRNIHHRGGGFEQDGRQEFDNVSHSRSFVRWRRFIGVRRVAGPAPVVQGQPRARCGGRCITARPTCGTRCKPKCSTCGSVAGTRQTNTAKVSGVKSVVKGDGNTVNQTVTIHQTNVYGGSATARSTTSSTSRTCPNAQGAQYIKTENGREVWSWNGQARLMKPKRNNAAVACVVNGTLGWTYASN